MKDWLICRVKLRQICMSNFPKILISPKSKMISKTRRNLTISTYWCYPSFPCQTRGCCIKLETKMAAFPGRTASTIAGKMKCSPRMHNSSLSIRPLLRTLMMLAPNLIYRGLTVSREEVQKPTTSSFTWSNGKNMSNPEKNCNHICLVASEIN